MNRDDAKEYERGGLEGDRLREIELAMLGRVRDVSRRITERVRRVTGTNIITLSNRHRMKEIFRQKYCIAPATSSKSRS